MPKDMVFKLTGSEIRLETLKIRVLYSNKDVFFQE